MKLAPGQQHSDISYCQPQTSDSRAAIKFVAVLNMGLAAVSLLMATPAFGKTTAIAVVSSEQQNLTCVLKEQSLVCDVQQPGEAPKTITFEQKPYSESTSAATELTPVTRTALLTPALDERLSSILLWTVYLGLPITMTAAIWSHDQRTREQTVNLAQHVTMLERIWQRPPTR